MEDLLGEQIAKIAILKLAVVVSVHIGEDLQYGVSLKFELQLVNHVSEVSEGNRASCSEVKCPEGCRDFSKLVNDALRKLIHLVSQN